MKLWLLYLLLFLFITSCYSPSSLEIIKDLKSIEGEWESYKGVRFSENWNYVNDSLFEGEGFSMNGVDTSFYEKLKILRVGDSIYYRVVLGEDKNAVNFLLADAAKSAWTFVNPENEFPNKIVYDLEEDTILVVTISDMKVNRKQLFYLKKLK